MRIHDQAFPTDGGARFFEIHAHNNHDAVADFVGELGEFFCVLGAGDGVVDRAGADDEQETFVIGENQAMDFFASMGDEGGLGFGLGQFGHELSGRGQDLCFCDMDIGRFLHGETDRVSPVLCCKSERDLIADSEKEVGRSPTPKRPAICFLSYPKTPARREECGKSNTMKTTQEKAVVNKIFCRFENAICKFDYRNRLGKWKISSL